MDKTEYTYNVLSSGSHGNCIIYHGEIMVDVGVSYKLIESFLPTIKYLFLTHRHRDHVRISTIVRLSANFPEIEIYGNEDVIKDVEKHGVRNTHAIPSNTWVDLIGYTIFTSDTQHNVPNVCYHIYKPILVKPNVSNEVKYVRDFKILHATDMGHLNDIEAINYDLYMIENNYGTEKIHEAIIRKQELRKFGKPERIHELRTLEDHFSNEQALEWLPKNNINGEVVWLHISNDYGVVERERDNGKILLY